MLNLDWTNCRAGSKSARRLQFAGIAGTLLCLLASPAAAQEKKQTTVGQALISYRGETLTQSKVKSMVESQRRAMESAPARPGSPQQLPEDVDLHAAYGWVREQALLALADQLKVTANEKQVKQQEQEVRKQLTKENWSRMKAAADFGLKAAEEYRAAIRAGEKDNATLRNKLWRSLGGEQNSAGVPRSAFDSTLDLFGSSDAALEKLRGSIPQTIDDAVADAREQFENASRLQAVQEEITSDLTLTDEDIARAQQGLPSEVLQQMQQAPGGLRQALLQMKKQEALERWLRPRILKELKFADKKFEQRFKVWLQQADARSAAPPPPPSQPGGGPPPPPLGASWR